jgi:radical SAM superfamily enzyme YgiQ (UPF0313 family)
MRVLLINPYYPISETPSPPLGLAYLAAALTEAGIETKVLDLVVFPYRHSLLPRVIGEFQPQIAGLTAVTMTFNSAIGVIQDIKGIDESTVTVMGGPHVTFCAQDTLEMHPDLDVIVFGEGERTIVDLSRAIEKNRDWRQVAGIAFRRDSGIVYTPARAPIADLDELPEPARGMLPLGRYRALGMPVSLTTSRGCPFKCIFCAGRKMVGARVRYRNARRVVDEMEYLNTLEFHQINIADDLFTANRTHCMAVCNEIIERRLEIRWTSFARVDTVSEEILSRMKDAGCSAVSFGIESANPQILNTIKKGITREQVVAAVEMCRQAGITPFASFILGLPGETPQTIRETLDFGEELKALGLSFGFHLLAPFPGTEIREKSAEYGIRILTDDWSRYHANRAIVETSEVDRYMMDQIVIDWESEYNRMLGDIKERMRNKTASDEEAQQVLNLERIVLVYDLMMESVIEKKGSWPCNGQSTRIADDLDMLSESVSTAVKADPQLIQDTLNHALNAGNLIRRIEEGRIKWQWADHLD